MSALTEARDTREILGPMSFEREAAGTVYAGALAAQNSSGKAVAASDTANLIVLGRAEKSVVSGETLRIRSGVFLFDNGSSTEALAVTDIGKAAYVVDDHTVGKVGGTNKIVAGIVEDVTSDGVIVRIGRAVGDLTADNADE